MVGFVPEKMRVILSHETGTELGNYTSFFIGCH